MGIVKNAVIFGGGYVLGARAGRARYEQIAGLIQKVARRPQVQQARQHATNAVSGQVGGLLDQVKGNIPGRRAKAGVSTPTPSARAAAPAAPPTPITAQSPVTDAQLEGMTDAQLEELTTPEAPDPVSTPPLADTPVSGSARSKPRRSDPSSG